MIPCVAPLVGAWIEICINNITSVFSILSLPSRERGLKSCFLSTLFQRLLVAPLVGAWIEIDQASPQFSSDIRRSPRGSVD